MVVEIPWQTLSQDALEGVIESFISREGTDYGEQEISLDQKISQIKTQLTNGSVIIVFDEDTESCNLLTQQQWSELQSRSAEDEYFGI